jgi:hypothetical protein
VGHRRLRDRVPYTLRGSEAVKETGSMFRCAAILALATLVTPIAGAQNAPASPQTACESLVDALFLTITRATLKPKSATAPAHCYVQGTLSGRIRFHMQLPLPADWNGRGRHSGSGLGLSRARRLRMCPGGTFPAAHDDRILQSCRQFHRHSGQSHRCCKPGHDTASTEGRYLLKSSCYIIA